jgi:hypothetical protein
LPTRRDDEGKREPALVAAPKGIGHHLVQHRGGGPRLSCGHSSLSLRRVVRLPPTIIAAVGGEGFSRTLGYAYQPDPDHTITFYERGPTYEQDLGVAGGTPCEGDSSLSPVPFCGSIPFTPDATPLGGEHEIVALVTNTDSGEITEAQLVAEYLPPAEPVPSPVSDLGATHSDGGIVVSWDGSAAAIPEAAPVAYNVDANMSGGAELLDVVPASAGNTYSVTFPNIGPQTGAQIEVAPMRDDDVEGAPQELELAPS